MGYTAFGNSGIPFAPKKREPLFATEEGGVEPVDSPVSPELASQFGFRMGTPTATTDNAAARAGVLAGGYKPTLQDPGMERRAVETARTRSVAEGFGFDPKMIPDRTPTRQESAEDDAYVAAQMAPVQGAEMRRQDGRKQERADLMADIQLTDAQRAAAFRQAFQEMTGREYSPEAVKEVYAQEFETRRTEGMNDAMGKILAEELAELSALDAKYGAIDVTLDPADPRAKDQERLRRMKEQEKADIRYKASQRRAPVLSAFTKDAVEGQSPDALAKALEATGRFYGVSGGKADILDRLQ